MSDNSKKRCRKSKLVPRSYALESVINEHDYVSTSVKELSSQLLKINEEIDNHDFDSVQNDFMSPSENDVANPLQNYMTLPQQNYMPSPMQFSIKVEVEECNEQDLDIKEEPITEEDDMTGQLNVPDTQNCTQSISDFDISKEAESLLVKTENIDLVPNMSEEYFDSPIELKYNTSLEPMKVVVKNFKVAKENKRKDVKYLVSPEEILRYQPDPNNVAAKMLFVEVRNSLGRTVKEIIKMDRHESLIQEILWQLKFSQHEEIFMYKCYICTEAWWHLYPFREHIRRHNDEDFMVSLEPNKGHEHNMIAYNGEMPKYMDIEINSSNCWQCGKPYSVHKQTDDKPIFSCSYCPNKFYTCSLLVVHEGYCFQEMLNMMLKDKPKLFNCPYCKVLLFNETDLDDHLVLRHSVRSDVPMAPTFKFCPYCNGKYFNFYLHVCPKRTVNRPCMHCKRKFPNKTLWEAHLLLTKNNVRCPICGYLMAKECIMTDHLLEKHSTDFTVCRKCLLCTDFFVVLTDDAERDHRLLYHKLRFDRRRGRIFEMVVIPNMFLMKPHEGTVTMKPKNKFVINPQTSVTLNKPGKLSLKPFKGFVTPKTINEVVEKPNPPSVTLGTAGKSLLKPLVGPPKLKPLKKVVIHPYASKVAQETEPSKKLKFIEKHKDLALGRVLRSKEGRALSKRLWGHLADVLNAEDSSGFRSPLQWNKFYNDYKCRIKNKNRKMAQSQTKTGGGPSSVTPLTALEERLCTILGPDNFKTLPVQQNPNEITKNDSITSEMFEVESDIQYMDEPALTYTFEESGPSYTLDMPSTSTAAPMQCSITVNETQSAGGAPRAKRHKENEIDMESHSTFANVSNIHESQSQCGPPRAKRHKGVVIENALSYVSRNSAPPFGSNQKVSTEVTDKPVTETPVIKIEVSESDTEEPDCAEPDCAEPDCAEPDCAELDCAEPDCAEPDYENMIQINQISHEDSIKMEETEFEEDNFIINLSNIKTEVEDVEFESNTADYEQLLSNVFRVSENFSNMRDEVKVEVQPIEEDAVNDENLNLETLEPEVILKSGYRKRRLYTCRKCGYKNYHREFKLHVDNKCEPVQEVDQMSPGYGCTKCNKSFGSMKKYVQHFTTHGYDSLTCPECFEEIETLALLTAHVTNHVRKSYVKLLVICRSTNQKKVLQCKKCKGKVVIDNFFAHWESHFELRPVGDAGGTQECEAGTVSTALEPETLMEIINLLTYNERGQRSTKVVRNCNVCHRHFERVNDCKRHLIEHLLADAYASRARNKALKCQICCVAFRKADGYKHHMRDHGSLPVYKCELCDKTFSDSSNFTKHKKIHNLRVLVCDICGKKFQAKISIIKHMEMHLTTEPFKCGLCPKVFFTQSEYKKHHRSSHDKTKLKFKCLICLKKFLCLKDKWDHMWEVHKERKEKADCPICHKSFRKYSEVKVHVKKVHAMGLSVFSMRFFDNNAKKQMAEALQKSLMNDTEENDKMDDETLIVFN